MERIGRPGRFRRYREIAEVLTRHGLVLVVEHLGLFAHLSWLRRVTGRRNPEPPKSWPDRVRLALTDLGPTYVKLGQLASTRSDVLPRELVAALETLQDDVPPFPFAEVRQILERVWGRPPEEVLVALDPTPLAAASLAQVHVGRLMDGREVVVKVRRPGVMRHSEADFTILEDLAAVAERRTEWGRVYGLRTLVDELVRTMRLELDYTIEAANTEQARANFTDDPGVVVPEVIHALSSEEVIVLERLEGIKVGDRDRLVAAGIDPKAVARRLVASLYQQVFEDGFFHADPHPGNIHVDEEGRLIWLDWGLVGNLSPRMRRRSVELILGLTQARSDKVIDALLKLGAVDREVDRSRLWGEVEHLRQRYYDTALGHFEIGRALMDLFRVAATFKILIPREYTLLAKAAITADGVVRKLDPELTLVDLSRPFARRLILNQLDPREWMPLAGEAGLEYAKTLGALPDELEAALKTVGEGTLRIIIEHKNLDTILESAERYFNRVALSFLLGGVIVGLAMVVHPTELDHIARLPIGEYAFALAVLLGLLGLVTAARRGKL